MLAWPTQLVFYEGEDESALKREFIMLSAKHNQKFSSFEVANYVFRNLKDPVTRAMRAAQLWSNDLEVAEAIRQLVNDPGSDTPEITKSEVKRRLLAISESASYDRDKIEALKTIAQIDGLIVKPIDIKTSGGTVKAKTVYTFAIDPDADKPPIAIEDDDDGT